MIKLTSEILSLDEAYRSIVRTECGGICVFVGTVRSPNAGQKVSALEYTSFVEMAEKELQRIDGEIRKKWPVGEVYFAHRTGRLLPGEMSVIVAVSAPHRADAFEACRYGIEMLKRDAPIWKEEYYEVGKAWVSG